MPTMKVQRICPKCSHTNIVEWNSQSGKANFTCSNKLCTDRSQSGLQNETSRDVVPSTGTKAQDQVVNDLESRPFSIICGSCQRKFDVNRSAKSATCRCGTVLLIGQVVPNVNDSLSRNVVTSKGPKTDTSPIHLGKLEMDKLKPM